MRAIGLCLVVALTASPAFAQRKNVNIAVAPFVTTAAGPEHKWIGQALASALASRVYQQKDLLSTTVRQLMTAMADDNIDPSTVADPKVAEKVARLVGADLFVVGTYEVKAPAVDLSLTLYSVFDGKAPRTRTVSGKLDKMVDLEANVAEFLADDLDPSRTGWTAKTMAMISPNENAFNVRKGEFGTKNVAAWKAATEAMLVLDGQSLSPKHAEKRAKLQLEPTALEAAKASAKKATELDSKYADAWALLGIAQTLLGDYPGASDSFDKVNQIGEPFNPTMIAGYAFSMMRNSRSDEAERALSGAVAKRPGFLLARGYLGELLTTMALYPKAVAVYDSYFRVAPHQPWALAQRGYAKYKMGDKAGAVEDTKKALEMVPDSSAILVQLASRYIDVGKLVEAEECLKKASETFPTEARIHVRWSYLYLAQGKDDLAIQSAEKALSLANVRSSDRDRAYANLNLGRAWGHKNNFEKAVTYLDTAIAEGVGTLAEVERDPKLVKLRADARYKKLTP